MRAVGRRLDDVVFGPESPARMRVVHVGLTALIGVRVALGPYRQLADQPAALFRPVSFLRWLDHMPAWEVIAAVQVAGVVAAVLAIMGKRRGFTYALAWLCFLFLAGLRASRGKILHNDLLLLLAATPFLLAPPVDDPSDREPSERCGWPVRTALVLVAASYFFTGYWKLRHSGIEWVTGDTMRWILVRGPVTAGNPPLGDLAVRIAESTLLSRASAAGILGFEITFPIVLVWPRARPVYAVWAVGLHVLTYLLLGLDYLSYAAVAVLVLVDWPRLWDGARARRRSGSAWQPGGG